ncbi:FecR domain-containing protein [bacterium]|nr:FecR domain-containing protein [candidate division CSSED10-310 bacterium]
MKIRFRWLVITIPISYLIFAVSTVLVILGMLGFVIFGGRFLEQRQEASARNTLELAEIRYSQAEEASIPKTKLAPAAALIQDAWHLMQTHKYRGARSRAEDAVQHLEYLLASFEPDNPGISGRFARITEISGVVEKLEPGRADWKTVGLNEILRNGTRIRTQKSSTAKLKFDDGSSIYIKSDSLIMIRELTEDEQTNAKWSNIELGVSEIEALIPEPVVTGSQFTITMPDRSQASVQEESNFSVSVNEKNRSVVKVYMGRVDILSGERQVALSAREAVILDSGAGARKKTLEPLTIPLPPRLIYPANVQLLTMSRFNMNPVYFRWTTVDEAGSYLLELANDYYFFDTIENVTAKENRAKLQEISPGNYYWRVSSINKAGLSSEPSPFNSFRIAFSDDLQLKEKDLTPPGIRIDRMTILGHIVDIIGRTESNASLYVNEQKEEVFEDGSFRALIEFRKPGLQEIFIEAYDSAGNVSTISREIRIQESSSSR